MSVLVEVGVGVRVGVDVGVLVDVGALVEVGETVWLKLGVIVMAGDDVNVAR